MHIEGVVVLVIHLSRPLAIRWRSGDLSFAPSVLTLQAITVMLWEVNSLCKSHSRVHTVHAPPTNAYSCWTGSHCWPAGSWMDISTDCWTCWAQCIGGMSLLSAVGCGTFPHPYTSSGRPHGTDQWRPVPYWDGCSQITKNEPIETFFNITNFMAKIKQIFIYQININKINILLNQKRNEKNNSYDSPLLLLWKIIRNPCVYSWVEQTYQ